MRRRLFLGLALAGLVPGCAATPGVRRLAPNSTLIVLRHADRNGEDLSETGRRRARALVDALAEFDIAAIYTPDIKRNFDTAAPLARARGQRVRTPLAADLTRHLVRVSAGKTVIWVGNKSNIRTIWEDLNLPEPVPLEYGDLAIIRADAGGTLSVARRFFGPR